MPCLHHRHSPGDGNDRRPDKKCIENLAAQYHEYNRSVKNNGSAGNVEPSPIQFVSQPGGISQRRHAGQEQQAECEARIFKKRCQRSNKVKGGKLEGAQIDHERQGRQIAVSGLKHLDKEMDKNESPGRDPQDAAAAI